MTQRTGIQCLVLTHSNLFCSDQCCNLNMSSCKTINSTPLMFQHQNKNTSTQTLCMQQQVLLCFAATLHAYRVCVLVMFTGQTKELKFTKAAGAGKTGKTHKGSAPLVYIHQTKLLFNIFLETYKSVKSVYCMIENKIIELLIQNSNKTVWGNHPLI